MGLVSSSKRPSGGIELFVLRNNVGEATLRVVPDRNFFRSEASAGTAETVSGSG